MIYTTTKCPNCGAIIEQSAGYADDLDKYIGPQTQQCFHCGNHYLTGKMPWSMMSGPDKAKIHSLQVVGTLIGGLKIALLCMLGLGMIFYWMFDAEILTKPPVPAGKTDPFFIFLGVPSIIFGYGFVIWRRLAVFKKLVEASEPPEKQ